MTEATDTHVKVELSTKHKVLTVERGIVKEVGDKLGSYNADGRYALHF